VATLPWQSIAAGLALLGVGVGYRLLRLLLRLLNLRRTRG